MLTTVKGYYDDGKIILQEEVAMQSKTEVIVTFLGSVDEFSNKLRMPGGLEGKVTIPDDFNEPLEDLKDYM